MYFNKFADFEVVQYIQFVHVHTRTCARTYLPV